MPWIPLILIGIDDDSDSILKDMIPILWKEFPRKTATTVSTREKGTGARILRAHLLQAWRQAHLRLVYELWCVHRPYQERPSTVSGQTEVHPSLIVGQTTAHPPSAMSANIMFKIQLLARTNHNPAWPTPTSSSNWSQSQTSKRQVCL